MDSIPEKKLRRYPYFVGILSIAVLSVIAQIIILWDCAAPLIVFETDPVSSVMSTCSEVIAGMYGITLTGYIFFADRFQNVSKDDESLYDAVQALLIRYNHLAGVISLMSLICICLGEGVVFYGSNTLLPQWLYRFWVNETLLLFFITFNIILYFVISVLDPLKIDRISTQKKAKLSKDQVTGDSEAFMTDWAAIEDSLRILRDDLISNIRFVPGAKSKPEIIHTLEILRNYGRIGHGLWRNLEKLRQYYNLALHDASMTVSQEMCTLAKEVRAELEEKTK